MAAMSYSTELRATLEAGIAALEEDIERLRRAIAALDGTYSPPPGPARRATSGSRSAAAVDPEALVSLLDRPEGATSAELASGQGASQARVLATLKELEAEGHVRRTGRRRGTRWHVVDGSAAAQPMNGASERRAPAAQSDRPEPHEEAGPVPQPADDAGQHPARDGVEEQLGAALDAIVAG